MGQVINRTIEDLSDPKYDPFHIHIRETDMPEDEELIRLRRRFSEHIMEYKLQVQEQEAYNKRCDEQHEKNMEAISALTKSTNDVVEAWKTAHNFQRFVRWLGGFGLIGVLLIWAVGKVQAIFTFGGGN